MTDAPFVPIDPDDYRLPAQWIDGRTAWLAEGKAAGYVRSDVRCATHDGDPLTPAEELAFEDGTDDPCIPVIRLADGPGEEYVPRFRGGAR